MATKKLARNRAAKGATTVDTAAPAEHGARSVSGAVRAASVLEVVSIRFVNFSALTSYGALDTLPTKVDVKIGFTRPKVTSAETRIVISSTFILRILPKDGGAPALELRATAELVYAKSADTAIPESDITEFAIVNAPFNAWSYWREFVQSALARLNLPIIAIPLFRIADAPRMMLADEKA
jgi:hypothetical protein